MIGQLSVASVTYRLFKVPKTASTLDTPVQVTYKGANCYIWLMQSGGILL